MYIHFGRRKPLTKPLAGIGQWLSSIQQRVVEHNENDLVVDIAAVDAVNSRELGEIAKLHLALRDRGRRLILRNAQDQVHELFEITRMNRLVEVHGLEPTAVS
jgi:anti-anti-sigma regulatory factor